MVKLSKPRKPVRHLKYVGISCKTEKRYRKQLHNLFEYVDIFGHSFPSSFHELDFLAGELINHLYQELEPHGYAGGFISGLKRFYPSCRRHIETAGLFFRNWKRGLSIRQALPIPADVLCGMAGIAFARGSPRTAVALLFGFCGLLRTSEIGTLMVKQLSFLGGGSLLVISLPDSKGAKRKNIVEQVVIYDRKVINFVAEALRLLPGNSRIFEGGVRRLAQEFMFLARFAGLHDDNISLYCLRRGGATWHFSKYGSIEHTQVLGRWEHAKTEKMYIAAAVSEVVSISVQGKYTSRFETGMRVLLNAAGS